MAPQVYCPGWVAGHSLASRIISCQLLLGFQISLFTVWRVQLNCEYKCALSVDVYKGEGFLGVCLCHHQAAPHMLLLSAEADEDVQSVGVKPQALVSLVLLDRSSGTSPSFTSQLDPVCCMFRPAYILYIVIDFNVLICCVCVPELGVSRARASLGCKWWRLRGWAGHGIWCGATCTKTSHAPLPKVGDWMSHKSIKI